MRIMQEQNIPAARQMREAGYSWRAIGRAFNVKEETVMAALDPIYRERMRQRTRDSRARNGRKPARRHVEAKSLPARSTMDVWPLRSAEGRELGIQAITVRMVKRAYDGGQSAGKLCVPLSLPYIPSLYARQHTDRET